MPIIGPRLCDYHVILPQRCTRTLGSSEAVPRVSGHIGTCRRLGGRTSLHDMGNRCGRPQWRAATTANVRSISPQNLGSRILRGFFADSLARAGIGCHRTEPVPSGSSSLGQPPPNQDLRSVRSRRSGAEKLRDDCGTQTACGSLGVVTDQSFGSVPQRWSRAGWIDSSAARSEQFSDRMTVGPDVGEE